MVQLGLFWLVCLSVCFIFADANEKPTIKPSKLVVEYGAKASATCYTTRMPDGIGWEASQGQIDKVDNVQSLTWSVQSLTQWDITPLCYVNWKGREQTFTDLPVTVYKLPDVLSVKRCLSPVIEGETCLLQCDVKNVAPVRYLEVRWFQNQFPISISSFDESITTPVNKSIITRIKLSREDDGAWYCCEAKLELGTEGPQPPPRVISLNFSIAVHYKPKFSNDTEILELEDEEIILNCSASANPPSVYTWEGRSLETEVRSSSLSILYPGNYTCTASNMYGKAKKLFIIKGKYHEYTTFWIILGVGLALALVLALVYIIMKKRSPSRGAAHLNKTSTPSALKEEGEELVSTNK